MNTWETDTTFLYSRFECINPDTPFVLYYATVTLCFVKMAHLNFGLTSFQKLSNTLNLISDMCFFYH